MKTEISLKEIISTLEDTLRKIIEYSETTHKIHPDFINALIPVSNNLTLILEILNYYRIKWDLERTSLIGQMDRIKIVTSSAYI